MLLEHGVELLLHRVVPIVVLGNRGFGVIDLTVHEERHRLQNQRFWVERILEVRRVQRVHVAERTGILVRKEERPRRLEK